MSNLLEELLKRDFKAKMRNKNIFVNLSLFSILYSLFSILYSLFSILFSSINNSQR